MSAYFCLPAAIDIHQTDKMKNARINCLKKIPLIREKINNINDQLPMCPNYMLGQMASMIIPGIDVKFQSKLINDYKIEIPIFKWKDLSILRVSYQVYNTDKDIEYLIKTLSEIL